ncbi:MAG: hypothetical protein ACO3FI_03585 [Cyclobacteriaceae bacterium]
MKSFIFTALLILITGLICIQSVAPLFHNGLTESAFLNYMEESGPDEDSDDREDIDKSVARVTVSVKFNFLSFFHFTGYMKRAEHHEVELLIPPPRS